MTMGARAVTQGNHFRFSHAHGRSQNKEVKPINNFSELLGKMLLLGCQLHLDEVAAQSAGTEIGKIFARYREERLAYHVSGKVQIFELGLVKAPDVSQALTSDWNAEVLFTGVNRSKAKYAKLVFQRQQNIWMTCARQSEDHAFGFALEDLKNPNFVYLAYPGISSTFEPLFLKVKKQDDNTFVYYKITAEDAGEDNDVLVKIVAVSEGEAPSALHIVRQY